MVAALAVVGSLSWLYLPYVTETLVRHAEVVAQPRVYTVECSEDYENYKRYPGCTPHTCGRAITDNSVTREEAMASILSLHSGALSMGKQFVNIYRHFGEQIMDVFSEKDFRLYREVCGLIQAETFDLDPFVLYLTKPTFFSHINSTLAKTQHDEHWHPHIDNGQRDINPTLFYPSFLPPFLSSSPGVRETSTHLSSIPHSYLLSSLPLQVSFSSGSENLHHVEQVSWGTLYTITVSFTCAHAIADPAMPITSVCQCHL
ncbi:2-oxoglutarate and iron-dependent oxygenase domain-containing protein 3-like [Salvelinus alpinus]